MRRSDYDAPLQSQIGNITLYLGGLGFLLVVGTLGYWAGYETYWSYWDTWVYWRYFVAGLAPTVSLFATAMFAIQAATGSRSTRPTFFLIVISGGVAYTGFFLVYEALVWDRCNNLDGSTPMYPQCTNPDFPVETFPKHEFLVRYFSQALLFVVQIAVFMFSYSATCTGLVAGNLRRNYETIGPDDEPSYNSASIGGDLNHHPKMYLRVEKKPNYR